MQIVIDRLGKVSVTVDKDYWDSGKCYDRLVVVEDDITKCCYLSRKPVPLGVELNDREYWIPFSPRAEGYQPKLIPGVNIKNINNESILGEGNLDLDCKYVQKEAGKGLSSNDYSDEDKEKLDNLSEQVQSNYTETNPQSKAYIRNKPDLSVYVQKETGKGLSTNDFSNDDKTKLDSLHNYDDSTLSGKVATLEDNYDSVTEDITEIQDSITAIIGDVPTKATLDKATSIVTYYNKANNPLFTLNLADLVNAGILESVVVTEDSQGNTVIRMTFNTSSGTSVVDIPIESIFDVDNYYTKQQTDTKITDAVTTLENKLGAVATSNDYNDLDNTPTKLSDFSNDISYVALYDYNDDTNNTPPEEIIAKLRELPIQSVFIKVVGVNNTDDVTVYPCLRFDDTDTSNPIALFGITLDDGYIEFIDVTKDNISLYSSPYDFDPKVYVVDYNKPVSENIKNLFDSGYAIYCRYKDTDTNINYLVPLTHFDTYTYYFNLYLHNKGIIVKFATSGVWSSVVYNNNISSPTGQQTVNTNKLATTLKQGIVPTITLTNNGKTIVLYKSATSADAMGTNYSTGTVEFVTIADDLYLKCIVDFSTKTWTLYNDNIHNLNHIIVDYDESLELAEAYSVGDDIANAIRAGKTVVCKVTDIVDDDLYAALTSCNLEDGKYEFTSFVPASSESEDNKVYVFKLDDTADSGYGWTYDTVTIPSLNTLQEKLVSGQNIKTINGESILGEGNINITSSNGGAEITQDKSVLSYPADSTGAAKQNYQASVILGLKVNGTSCTDLTARNITATQGIVCDVSPYSGNLNLSVDIYEGTVISNGVGHIIVEISGTLNNTTYYAQTIISVLADKSSSGGGSTGNSAPYIQLPEPLLTYTADNSGYCVSSVNKTVTPILRVNGEAVENATITNLIPHYVQQQYASVTTSSDNKSLVVNIPAGGGKAVGSVEFIMQGTLNGVTYIGYSAIAITPARSGIQGATGATGAKGEDGVTPSITASATVTQGTGTPAVNVTKSGTDATPHFKFDFTNIGSGGSSQGGGTPQGIFIFTDNASGNGSYYKTMASVPTNDTIIGVAVCVDGCKMIIDKNVVYTSGTSKGTWKTGHLLPTFKNSTVPDNASLRFGSAYNFSDTDGLSNSNAFADILYTLKTSGNPGDNAGSCILQQCVEFNYQSGEYGNSGKHAYVNNSNGAAHNLQAYVPARYQVMVIRNHWSDIFKMLVAIINDESILGSNSTYKTFPGLVTSTKHNPGNSPINIDITGNYVSLSSYVVYVDRTVDCGRYANKSVSPYDWTDATATPYKYVLCYDIP